MKVLYKLLSVMLFVAFYADAFAFYADGRYTNRLTKTGDYIFVASENGLVRYDKTNGECVNFTAEASMADYTTFTMVYGDSRGRLFMGSQEDGVYCCDLNTGQTAKMWSFGMFGTDKFYYFAAAEDSEGAVVYSDAVFYIRETGEYSPVHLSMVAFIMDMEFDSKGRLWIAVSDFAYGALVYDAWQSSGSDYFLEDNNATSLAIDRNDRIWLACDNGIISFDSATRQATRYDPGEYGFPGADYIACDVDDDGNVWFTSTHYLLKYDGEKFESHTVYGYNGAISVLCDGDDVWVYSTDNKLIRFRDGEFAFIDMPATEAARVEEIADGEREFSVRCSGGVLSVSGTKEISRLNVYDAAGRCVRSVVCNDGETSAVADLSGLCSGVCVAEIFHDGGRTTSLFMAD